MLARERVALERYATRTSSRTRLVEREALGVRAVERCEAQRRRRRLHARGVEHIAQVHAAPVDAGDAPSGHALEIALRWVAGIAISSSYDNVEPVVHQPADLQADRSADCDRAGRR